MEEGEWVALGTFIPAPEGSLLLFNIHPPGGGVPPQGPVAAALHVMAQGLAPPHPAGLHPPQPLLTAACSAQHTHSGYTLRELQESGQGNLSKPCGYLSLEERDCKEIDRKGMPLHCGLGLGV